jgi:alanine racemase
MRDTVRSLARATWLEIDLDAFTHNVSELRALVGTEAKLLAAVKANAYGHGLVKTSQTLIQAGVDMLACGSVEDGVELRSAGIRAPILIFASNTVAETARTYMEYDLIPTILEVAQAEALAEVAPSPVKIFAKVDTGRGRLGIIAEEALSFLQKLAAIPKIQIMGVYSHFAGPDWPDRKPDFAEWQLRRFKQLREEAERAGLEIPIWEIAQSSAAITMPHSRCTACCTGRLIWGFSEVERRQGHPNLKGALTWKSRIIQKKKVTAGKFGPNNEAVRLESSRIIGVAAVGLHDGLMSTHARGGEVLVRGKKVRVWSPVTLEHLVIDLTNCPEAETGDEVVIIGKQGKEEISIDELVRLWKVPLTQILAHLSSEMARVYFKGGKPVGISSKSGYRDV